MELPSALCVNGSTLDIHKMEAAKMKEKHLTIVIKLGTVLVNVLETGHRGAGMLTAAQALHP